MKSSSIFFILFLCAILITSLFLSCGKKLNEGISPDIVISLTTSPKRISKIKPTLDRIMEQTILPSAIVLNLPHVFKRTGDKFDKLPDFITSNKLIQINKCEDIGPATKILPTRRLFDDPETIIISIDDDILYHKGMIETFLKYSKIFPDSVISSSSWYIVTGPPKHVKEEDIPPNTYFSEFLEGYSGVLYKKKFLDTIDISDEYILQLPKYCFQSDDFFLSNYLNKNKIPIFIINKGEIVERPMEHGEGSDALHNGANETSNGNDDNYVKCAAYMNEKNDLHINHYKNKL
uniref:Glycosyl transferase 64 domain-containing protein n=1 Tax=viral metagenome TaxID=1070528 RepID=A0A6C0B8K3_9ZZZZ